MKLEFYLDNRTCLDDNISTLLKDLIKSRRNGFMDGKMKVAVMNGIGKMGFEERDIPTPKADEVLVKLDYLRFRSSLL